MERSAMILDLWISGDLVQNLIAMYKGHYACESVRNMSSIDLYFDFQTLLGKKLNFSRAYLWGSGDLARKCREIIFWNRAM